MYYINLLFFELQGVDRTKFLRLHTVIVLSKVDDCCLVYASPAVPRRLDATHNQGLRLAPIACRSTLVIINIYNEACRQNKFTLRYHLRFLQKPSADQHPLIPLCPPLFTIFIAFSFFCGVSTLHTSLSLPTPAVLTLQCSKFPPWLLPRTKVWNISPSNPKASSLPQELFSLFMNHPECHHCDSGVHGWHKVLCWHRQCCCVSWILMKYSFITGVSQELSDLHALRIIYLFQLGTFVVFTDSLDALHSIQTFPTANPLVLKI